MEKTNAYVTYALINIPRLFCFYDEKVSTISFLRLPRQTKQNRKQRKKKRKKKQENSQMPSAEEKERVARKSKFQYPDSIPLVVFGDGMENKNTVAIRDHVGGVTGILHKELLQKSRQFKNVLVGINEFRTSKVFL
ncbi:hypothetical protein RMATCC62417_13479 [Rhizopus microsporus]|nr:hypothetical protein RMATCC62417_13479 [Rhizopus microsporus]